MDAHGVTNFEQEVLRRLKRIDNTLHGNGREGLVALVARLDERVEDVEKAATAVAADQKSLWSKVQQNVTAVALLSYVLFKEAIHSRF